MFRQVLQVKMVKLTFSLMVSSYASLTQSYVKSTMVIHVKLANTGVKSKIISKKLAKLMLLLWLNHAGKSKTKTANWLILLKIILTCSRATSSTVIKALITLPLSKATHVILAVQLMSHALKAQRLICLMASTRHLLTVAKFTCSLASNSML